MAALRVGLVGYGMAGRDIHAPLLRAAELPVTHVVTAHPQRAANAAAELPDAHVVPTFDDLLAAADALDVVVLASPSGVHVEQALAAIDRGLPVVVDKPFAVDLPGGRAVVDAARRTGVPVTVFQNRRWDSEHLTARAVLASSALGEVIRYEGRYERWRPEPKSRWREHLPSESGGGVLMDLQSHLVDGAFDLFGPVQSVYAEERAITTVGDDVSYVVLGHTSGVRSHLSATSLAGAPGPRTRILGRAACYVVAGGEGEPTVYDSFADLDDEHRGWLVRGEDREPIRRTPGGWEDFYPLVDAMLRAGGPPPVDPADSLAVLAILDAARRSARDNAVQPPVAAY